MFLSTGMSKAESIVNLLALTILFLLILAAAVYTSKFIGKLQSNQLKNSNFKIIESFKIAQGKYLQLVKISKEYYVIAIGKDEITLITKLNEDEILQREDIGFEQKNFSKYLNDFINKRKDEKDKTYKNKKTDNKGRL